MRSLAFNVLFWVFSTLYVLFCTVLALVPGKGAVRWGIRRCVAAMAFLMRHVAGIKLEARRLEKLPKGPVIIAAKHQSYGDGFFMLSHVQDLAFVTGDHLERFPFVAKVLKKLGAIVVDNCGGPEARKDLAESFKIAAAEGRSVLIYPEGHLSKVGEKHRYRSGVWHLQEAAQWPVVPVATNLGLRWQQEEWEKRPGVAVIEFLDPIEPGLPKADFMAKLERVIEGHTARLVAEGRLSDAGVRAPGVTSQAAGI
jgi:1-acyl-sn-glycerol-3-phosphate acyltransferase